MPHFRRGLLAFGLGLSACAAPPRIEHVDRPRDVASATPPALDPETEARSWLRTDPGVRRVQAASTDLGALPMATSPALTGDPASSPALGGQSMSLQMALYGALTSNPDLVTLRQGSPIANAPSPEAVEVARRFPTTLNPTIWIDYRPITLIPPDTFGSSSSSGGAPAAGAIRASTTTARTTSSSPIRQPIELGHQTTHRYHIAKAALDQQQWTVIAGRADGAGPDLPLLPDGGLPPREAAASPTDLADFNDRLLASLQKRAGGQPDGHRGRRDPGEGREPGDPPAGQGGPAGLPHGADRPPQPDRHARDGRHGRAAGRVHAARRTSRRLTSKSMVREALANRPDIHAAQAQIRRGSGRPSGSPRGTASRRPSSARSTRWTRRASSTSA